MFNVYLNICISPYNYGGARAVRAFKSCNQIHGKKLHSKIYVSERAQ